MSIKLNDKFLSGFLSPDEIANMQPSACVAYDLLLSKNGPGNDFLGWVDLPENYDKEEFARIKLAAEKIKTEGLTNVKFFAQDVNLLRGFETDSRAEIIYINFCDPWHKHSYRRRRLTHEQHLKLWEKLLTENGEIHFKTDNQKLFEFSLNSFSDYGMRLKNITLDLHNSDYEGNIMTEYEMLFSEKGQPIYRCEAMYK